jgi:hypothetical protein
MKRLFTILSIALLIMLAVPCFAVANGPPPDSTITIFIQNAPSVAAYVDILVDKTLPEVKYGQPNPAVVTKYPALKDSPLVGLDSNGYVSYSLYYYRDYSYDYDTVYTLPISRNEGNRFSGYPDADIHSIKIALLEGSGEILRISDVIPLIPDSHLSSVASIVHYDSQSDTAKVHFPIDISSEYYSWGMIELFFIALVRILFSTGIEILIALPFKIKPIWVILVVNLFTQVIISIGIPMLSIQASYFIAVMVFEVFVYVTEFLAYMKFTREPKWRKVLLYTVVSNTSSLVLGLFMNSTGLFLA